MTEGLKLLNMNTATRSLLRFDFVNSEVWLITVDVHYKLDHSSVKRVSPILRSSLRHRLESRGNRLRT